MSFSAKNEYGKYNHNHIYGFRYLGNWYQITTSIALLDNNKTFVGSTSLFTTHEKFNANHQNSAVEIEAGGVDIKVNTSTETSLQPSICVYFWRRIS